MEDTPAAKAGISGDQILKINGTSTERMELQDAVNVLRARRGKSNAHTCGRRPRRLAEYTLDRVEIKVQSVKAARLLDQELTGRSRSHMSG